MKGQSIYEDSTNHQHLQQSSSGATLTLTAHSDNRTTPQEEALAIAKQIKMTKCNGVDPEGWVANAEQYFTFYGTMRIRKCIRFLLAWRDLSLMGFAGFDNRFLFFHGKDSNMSCCNNLGKLTMTTLMKLSPIDQLTGSGMEIDEGSGSNAA